MEKNFYFNIAYDTFFVASTSKINILCAQFFIFFHAPLMTTLSPNRERRCIEIPASNWHNNNK